MFAALLLSHLFVFIIPVTIGSIVYVKIEQIMIDNSYRSNSAMLEQMKHMMDSRTQEIDYLMRQIASNPKQQHLMEKNGEATSSAEQYQFFEFMQELSRYSAYNTLFHDFYVYFGNTDTILTTSMKTDSKTFYNQIYSYKNISYEDYKSRILLGDHFKSYLPSQAIVSGARAENMVTYVQSLPLAKQSKPDGSLVILIDEAQIRSLLDQTEGLHEGNMYILNEQMEVIIGPEEGKALDVSDREQLLRHDGEQSGYYHTTMDGEEHLAAYTKSKVNGWTYLSVFPKKVVLEQVNTVKKWSVAAVVACLLGGIGLSVYLTRRHYGPIQEVVHTIRNGRSQSVKGRQNELKLIKDTVESLFGKEHQLENKISQQVPIIRADFLNRLVCGQVDADAISRDDLTFMGLYFEHSSFSVILFDIDDASRFMKEDTEREWALIRFILMNVSEELLEHGGYAFEMEKNRLAVLMNINTGMESEQRIKPFTEDVVRLMEARFRTSITAGVSACHEGLSRIADGYGEALIALSYKMIKGTSGVIYYENVRHTPADSFIYPVDIELQLINQTKHGDPENAERLLDKLYEMNFSSKSLSPEKIGWLFQNMQSTLIKIMDALRLAPGEILAGESDLAKYFASAITADDKFDRIKAVFLNIGTKIKEERTDKGEELYNRIVGFIEEHYHDNNLSLTMIAEHFDLSPIYISAFFKKQSGDNVSELITRVRIKHAKRLLAEELTINEIALRIGYSNNIVLTKVFKKHEGITPGKYRESLSDNKPES